MNNSASQRKTTQTQTVNRLSTSGSQKVLRRINSSITNFSGSGIKAFAPGARPPNHIDYRKKNGENQAERIPKKQEKIVNVSVLSDASLKKQTLTQTLTLQKSLQESSNLTSSFDRIFGHLRSKSLQTSA
jgi:hypothetical protein